MGTVEAGARAIDDRRSGAKLILTPAPAHLCTQIASGLGMILDILTVLFLVTGCLLLWSMIAKRRRDVLHGPYVTKEKDPDLSED